jgi:predicted dehydrogenase
MSKSAAVLSLGIVGAGEITRKSHLPVLVNIPDIEIAWIYDRSPEPAVMLAQAYRLKAVHSLSPEDLPPCDVVLLAIPVDARAQYLDQLCSSGRAAFCEKPFAQSSAEHEHFATRFEPYALGAGFMRRFFRSTILLRRIVSEGIFGPLLKIDLSEGNRSKGSGVDASFLDDARLGASRGVLMDLGSHSIDLALYVSGALSFEVRSCATVLDGNVDRRLAANVQLITASGPATPVELNYCVSWLDRQDNRIQLTFKHAKVWSALGPAADVFVGNTASLGDALILSSHSPGATTYNQAFYLEWQDFLSGLREKRESTVSARSALLTTSLVETLLARGDTAHA